MYIQHLSLLNALWLFFRCQSKITNNDTEEFLILTQSLQHVISSNAICVPS